MDSGLPNITGTFQDDYYEGWSGRVRTGSFYLTKTKSPAIFDGGSDNTFTTWHTGFDASLSNPIYGNSQVVQPASVKVNMWHRIS